MNTELTILNVMAGREIEPCIAQHKAWGLRWMDLKDGIFGKGIVDLTDDEAGRLADMMGRAGLRAYCLSSTLFDDDAQGDATAFSERVRSRLARAAAVAMALRPVKFRLIAARLGLFGAVLDATGGRNWIAHVTESLPWLAPLYAEAIEALAETGAEVTIENECHQCILRNPQDVVEFFARLRTATDRRISFTWDVQNMWQMGHFPSVQSYRTLKPLLGFYHVKGGMAEKPGGRLVYASSLADASWPVAAITREVMADGVSPVICINPPHGKAKPEYDYASLTERDITYMRRLFSEAL